MVKKKKQTPEGENQPDLKPNPEAPLGFFGGASYSTGFPVAARKGEFGGFAPKLSSSSQVEMGFNE